MFWFVRIWALPTTLVSFPFIVLAWMTKCVVRVEEGVVQVHGPAITWFLAKTPVRASALTLGHVVLARDEAAMARCWNHELGHVRQVERLGVFFLPAYFLASLIALLRRKHYYRDNWFEVDAERYSLEREATAASV